MTESSILKRILLALNSRADVRVFRNNVGVAQTANGSVVRYGLLPGSGDLIGWKTIRVKPEDVGKELAVFLSVEVKRPGGKLRKEQELWMKNVNKAGGLAVMMDNEGAVL